MQIHPWNLTPDEAIDLQQKLRSQVRVKPLAGEIARVGGVDVGFGDDRARAAVAVRSQSWWDVTPP